MKKLLVLVFALIAVLGLTFAVSAADASKIECGSIQQIYEANGTVINGGGMNGGSYSSQVFDGSYDGLYNNGAGRYIIVDLNAALAGGYYVTDIKVYHAGNTNYSLYYTSDGVTWKPIVEKAKVAEATYAVNDYATQVKYVFDTVISWTPSIKEVEIYGINPADMACTHPNLASAPWVDIPDSATCTWIGSQKQVCPDCGEEFTRESDTIPALGHDFYTEITKEGTSVSYGEGIIKCTRCDYALDFKGEVDLTDTYYAAYGETLKYVSINPSSIGHQGWGNKAEYLTDGVYATGDNNDSTGWGQWYAATEDDENEYVMFNFLNELDLTKVVVAVANDAAATLRISARNMETGEFEVVKELATYDESLGAWASLNVSTSLLGVTTDAIKFQVISDSRKQDGFVYKCMIIEEIDLYGIAPGCGLDAENHECTFDTFVDFVKAPTCQDAGTATYKCACNATTVVEVAASEEFHSYVELEGSRIPSTCTVGGFYTDKCEFCGAEVTVDLEIDAENGHEYEEVSRTEPDCENAGLITYKCLNCEGTKDEEIKALGHTYGEPVVVPSTCKDNGTSTVTCTVCGNEEVTTLETTGCTWEIESIITEPTCAAEGEANYVCSVCGETKVDVVAATGNHAWDVENYVVLVAPSCEGTGAATFTCTACATTKRDVLPALGHSFTSEVDGTRVDATCTEDGSVEMACVNGCGKSRVETLKATDHAWGEPTDDSVYPTCTEAGTLNYVCANCQETKTETVKATGHVWSDAPETLTPPTCVAAGSGKYYCINCWVVYDEERGEVEIPADPTAHADMIFNDAYTFAICPDCDVFAFYGMHSGVGDNNLTWYFMGDMVNIYSDDNTLDEYYNTVLAYDEETGIYTVTLVQIVSDDEEVIPVTYAGCTATVVINTDGTLLITLTAADESTLVFGKDPSIVEPENNLLNGTYAYLDMGGNVNAKFKFDNGTIYVLEDNNGYNLPESFTYDYYPATGEIVTPEGIGNFSVIDGVIYFGRGWALTPVKDEEPVDPEKPVVNYGNVIGSFEVETTDTYCWIDAGSYTAEAAGQYSFKLPAGLGMWRLEYADQWPAIVEDIVDYYANTEGAYLVINLEEGETFNFYVASETKAEWTVEVYYYVQADEFNGEYYHAESNQLFFTFDNGTLTVVDNTGYFNVGGTYTYKYNASTGEFTLSENATFTLLAVGGVLKFNGMLDLVEYVPETIYTLVLGENVFVFTNTNYRFNEVKVIFTATQAGTYIIAPADGEENLVIFVEDEYGAEMVDVPYIVTLAEGEELALIITTGANVMTDAEDTVEFTVALHSEHAYVAGEPAEDGSVTYTCVCGDTYVVNNSLVNGEYYMDGTPVVFNNGEVTIGSEVMSYTYNVTTGMIDIAPGMFFQVIDGGIYFRGIGQPLHKHDADSFVTEVTAPTCTTDGYTTYICKFCYDFTYTDDVVEATGHSYAETSRVESTCTTAGSVTYTCSVCGDSYEEALELAAHTEVEIPAVRPLPSTNHKGYTAGTMCSVCEAVVVAPQEFTAGTSSDANFKINSATLSLGEDIGVTYNATHPANSDASSMYMVFIFNGKEYEVESAGIVSGNRYRFVFKGMRAELMAANIEAYVYAVEDGNYVMKSHLQYSVKQYCVNQLKRNIDANFKALIFSVLNLGDCTQLAVDSTTPAEQLISNIVAAEAGVEVPDVAVETIDPSYNVQGITGDRTQGYDWKSGGIQLGSSVQLKLQFVATEVEGLVLNFNVDGRIIEVDASELTKGSDGRYTVYFQVKVLEYDKPVTCTFVKDGVQVGSTLTYSVYTYIVRQYASASFPEADKNFVKALYEYAEAVKAMNAAN